MLPLCIQKWHLKTQALTQEKRHKQMSYKIFLIGIIQKFLRGYWCEPLPKVWVINTSVLCTSVVCCDTFGSGHTNNLLGILHCSINQANWHMREIHVISIGLWIVPEFRLSIFGLSGRHLYIFPALRMPFFPRVFFFFFFFSMCDWRESSTIWRETTRASRWWARRRWGSCVSVWKRRASTTRTASSTPTICSPYRSVLIQGPPA